MPVDTPPQSPAPLAAAAAPTKRPLLQGDLAYVLPMAVFLAFTWAGGHWKEWFPASYMAKTFVVPVLLFLGWKAYTRIAWTHLTLGVLVGVVGLVQWVGMEKLLIWYGPAWTRMSVDFGKDLFNPFDHFKDASAATLWSFILLRWACAALVVPVMEELFWRDYLWRTIQSPNNFKLPAIGEPDWKACLAVSAAFATVHVQWLTALVWGLMIGVLLIRTKSLGACIVAHGVTNFLLGAYVLACHHWPEHVPTWLRTTANSEWYFW